MLYATTTSRAQTCVHSALLLCSLKTKSHRAIMCNCNVHCATQMCHPSVSQYLLPSILLSGWIIVGSQQWPSEGNPSQEHCVFAICVIIHLVLLYSSCALIHLRCVTFRRESIAEGLYLRYVLLYTCNTQCAMC